LVPPLPRYFECYSSSRLLSAPVKTAWCGG
jgi:hypothetical protein